MNVELNISDIPDDLKGGMSNNKIEFSKKMSQLSAESRKSTKTGKCLYCSKEASSYCNSHSVPASFLKNIADNGKLYTHAGLIDLPLLKRDVGVNKAGTFLIICRACDSKIFNDYESKNNYKMAPTQKMLAQIAMKNYLKTISQRAFSIKLHENIGEDTGFDFSKTNKINDSDLKENVQGFNRAKKVDAKCIQDEYYLFLYESLDYVVPMAFQHQVALAVDLEGGVVNNLYNYDFKYKIQMVHIVVFPLEDSSIVLMFTDKNDKRYRQFIRQLNRLPSEEKLEVVNYIIFLYSEDFFLSKKVSEDVMSDKILKKLSGKTGHSIIIGGGNIIDTLKENYELSNLNEIPNLLSAEYKIN